MKKLSMPELLVTVIIFSLPMIINFGFHPLWLMENSIDTIVNITLAEMALNVVVYPVYLAVVCNVLVVKKRATSSFNAYMLISSLVLIICTCIYYWNWGISTGRLNEPDSWTMIMMSFECFAALVFYAICMGVALLARKLVELIRANNRGETDRSD